MGRAFVAIDDPVHHLLRELARCTPLVCARPEARPRIEYRILPSTLPPAYCALAWFHGLGGLALAPGDLLGRRVPLERLPGLGERAGGFDAVRLDRRCCRDLRLAPDGRPLGLLSAELLSFGTGILRARNDNPAEPVHRRLGRRYGRLWSRHELVFARLHTLFGPSGSGAQKESFDSTNLIYGDSLGELEQLWERRADVAFLDQVADSLQGLRQHGHFNASVHPPMHLPELKKLHLRSQAMWQRPPATGRSLLRRIEYILNHTLIDSSPCVALENADPPSPAAQFDFPNHDWQGDDSGFDGWLGAADLID
jgi:hypothetical protein